MRRKGNDALPTINPSESYREPLMFKNVALSAVAAAAFAIPTLADARPLCSDARGQNAACDLPDGSRGYCRSNSRSPTGWVCSETPNPFEDIPADGYTVAPGGDSGDSDVFEVAECTDRTGAVWVETNPSGDTPDNCDVLHVFSVDEDGDVEFIETEPAYEAYEEARR